MIYRIACAALSFVVTQGCVSDPASKRAVSDGRYAMGTVLEIALEGVEPQLAARVLDDLYGVANRLDRLLSIYDPESDVSRLNRGAGGERQPVDAEVEQILERSIAYSELTRGAFDVTIGPLVDLWVAAADRDAPPTALELAAARKRVGAARISVVPGEGVLLGEAGMKLDLGGIAKGYALDRMLPLLERHGIESALLNFGQSSSWALGAPAGSAGWRLLIRGPEGRMAGLITLRDQALSVSGSQGQWVEIGGRRYGHIIDPRSGEPLMRARQAVVVSQRASLAEALSLALLVLDADLGLALVAAQPDCEGLLIEGDGALRSTPGWDAAVHFEPLAEPPEVPIGAPRDRTAAAAQAALETLRSVGGGTHRPQLSDLRRRLRARW
ncbi:MAG: FAD:protein FMN transferase [Deltaproteobacteria bacterium]|nr:FAD:protein FMN transferase [Deltaproteobacteria bacterium]